MEIQKLYIFLNMNRNGQNVNIKKAKESLKKSNKMISKIRYAKKYKVNTDANYIIL